MKALVYHAYGTPDVLSLQDIAKPIPKDDEVLVRVHASSINDYDWHLLTGTPAINRMSAPFRPKHQVLGSDVAGRVEAVGSRVTRSRPGDEVYGDMSTSGFGAFAEYVVAPASTFATKPASLTFEQAAAVPQAGGLAVTGLRSRLPLASGARVLVNGAGGGVGTFAVQIAKSYGADVTGVDSARKLDAVLAAGADRVIDYAVEDFTENGQTYDVILDVACFRPMHRYRRSLRPGGMCALTGGSIPRVLFTMAAGPVVSLFGSTKVGVPMWRPNDPGEVALLSGMLESGAVRPVVDRVFALADVPEAFRYFGAQQHRGKIVVTMEEVSS